MRNIFYKIKYKIMGIKYHLLLLYYSFLNVINHTDTHKIYLKTWFSLPVCD